MKKTGLHLSIQRLARSRFVQFVSVFAVYFATVLAFAWTDLKTGANYDHLFIRATSDIPVSEIAFVSPWGSQTVLQNWRDGVWRVPGKEKRLVSKVIVTIPQADFPTGPRFEYAIHDDPEANWTACDLLRDQNDKNKFELMLPKRSSWLFKKYNNTINWQGDSLLFLRPGIRVGYTFLLLGFLLSAIYIHRRTIRLSAREVISVFKPSRNEALVGIIVLGLFMLLNFRNADLSTVMYRQFDELSILRAIKSGDIAALIYGFFFNVTSLPFLIPGFLADNFAWSIFGGRMQSAAFMLLVALIFHRILALYYKGANLTILSFFPFLVPFYWVMGTLFHPDAQMTAFVLSSCYFLLKDQKNLGQEFNIACFFFAAAVAVKMHALMFAPLIPLYWLSSNFQQRLSVPLKSIFGVAAILIVSFLVLEPRMLSFSVLLRNINSFLYQMWTNKTGFDLTSSTAITLSQKLSTINELYSPTILLLVLAITVVFAFVQLLRSKLLPLSFLHASNFIVLSYYAFSLNKDWSYYYLAPYFLFVAASFIQMAGLSTKTRATKIFPVGVIVLQLMIPLSSWGLVVSDYYMPTKQISQKLDETNRHLLNLFKASSNQTSFLISYGIPFDYQSIDLMPSQINYIATDQLNDIQQLDYSFLEEYEIDHVVLNIDSGRKDFPIVLKFRDDLTSLDYVLLFQSDVVAVYSSESSLP